MRWFVTFGQYHPLAEHWIEVEADSYSDARAAAFLLFGRRFGFVYGNNFDPKYFSGGKVGKTIHFADIPLTYSDRDKEDNN